MKMRHTAPLVAVLVLLLTSAPSRGGGLDFPDNGSQALGRGGAFTAKADDLTALQYNVAGLTKLRGTHLLVDVNLCSLSASFQRAGAYPDDTYLDASRQPVTQPWSGQPFPRVENRVGAFPIPIIGASSDFGLERLTFGLGLSGPSSVGKRGFPETVRLPGTDPGTTIEAPAPQRFDLLDEDILIAYVSFAAAWQATSWLSVGGAFQWGIANVKEHVYAMAYTNANECRSGEAWACSTKVGVDLWDWFFPTGIVSLHARPARAVDLGLSFRFPISATTTGNASMTLPPALSTFSIEATAARVDLRLPFILRSGARYIFGPREDERGDLELDVQWEGWSRVDAFDATFTTSLGEIAVTVPHRYRDTVSVRLGGAYNLRLGDHRLPLRAGLFYDTAAAPDEWSRLDFDAFTRVGGALGAGYTLRGITFNAAVAYVHMPTRHVTGSQVTPIYAIGEAPPDQPGLDGTFQSRLWVVSLGAAASFDALLRRGSGRR